MSVFSITSESVTDWQFGPIRKSLDRRTKEDDEDKEEYLNVVSITRFRDHKNVTAIAEISNTVAESATGIDASFQGATECNVDAAAAYNPEESPTYARWFLQDSMLEPIERQGSTFIRVTQEWTVESGSWTEGGWK
jgi:hypothetical protein